MSAAAGDQSGKKFSVAIIGAGPAGLMAAEVLAQAGMQVAVYDRMASPARKFLMAGRGGLNLTHTDELPLFLSRYGDAAEFLAPFIRAFPPSALISWAEGLGQETFVGSSGRVFPKAMKASPLLRAWLSRLAQSGVSFHMQREWRGFDARGNLLFARADGGEDIVNADATLLALGGASWPRLGSDGAWADILRARGVQVNALRPANCGFASALPADFHARFQGQPLSGIALLFRGKDVRGEAMVTARGFEGGAIYALSRDLREAIAAEGSAQLEIDLRPGLTAGALGQRLARPRGKESLSNFLRKALSFPPVAVALLRAAFGENLAREPQMLAAQIKRVPVTLTATAGLLRAISSAGGVARDALDDSLMLKAMPGVHAAGEMIDWEAPTGGYLLQACFAMGVAAARGIVARAANPN
ncbi:MAG TPA: TIGR03862 family flavoprotein [Micropepsaceae bacterium]|nr:TIGR03862 family flavoprotein [Micropepsaceae bacterium]